MSDTMMTPGKRIRELRIFRNLSQGALSELCGWEKAGRISNYENGSRQPKITDINIIAKVLNCDPTWLICGKGINPFLTETAMGDIRKNIPEGKVPIIEWDEISDWLVRKENVFLGRDWEFTDSPEPKNKDLFALIIKGESMIGSPKSFNPGSIVIIKPGLYGVHGDYVLVQERGADEPILRQLIIEGSREYIKPLNSKYGKIIEKTDFSTHGVVLDHRDPRKILLIKDNSINLNTEPRLCLSPHL